MVYTVFCHLLFKISWATILDDGFFSLSFLFGPSESYRSTLLFSFLFRPNISIFLSQTWCCVVVCHQLCWECSESVNTSHSCSITRSWKSFLMWDYHKATSFTTLLLILSYFSQFVHIVVSAPENYPDWRFCWIGFHISPVIQKS